MKKNNYPIIPQIIAIVLLLWAILPINPYGYYILMRVAVCAILAYLVLLVYRKDENKWVWILGVTAFVYNPIVPLHLGRVLWSIVNIISIAIIIKFTYFIKLRRGK